MIRHYILVAFRNLVRNASFSLINITGLALGLACSLLIYLWAKDELSIDNFHTNSDRLYRVYVRQYFDGQLTTGYNSPASLPAELKKSIPEVQYATGFVKFFRLSLQDDVYETFQVDDKIHKMKGSRAEEDFFKMFSYTLLYGSPENALSNPMSLVVSRKMAVLFFGSPEAAMGKMVRFDGRMELAITGVFEDVPVTSTDRFDYLMNWDAWVKENPFKQSWAHFGTSTYIQLHEGADPVRTEEKIRDFLKPYLKNMRSGVRVELGLQPFGEQYLYSTFVDARPSTGRIEYIRLFSGVGLFILLIACINFMNLSTARSAKRAREVGVRKVVGSSRNYLTLQFIGEAMLFTVLSVLLALMITGLALPAFNALTGKEMVLPLHDASFFVLLLMLVVVTAFMAGSYPAWFLSSFQPVKILKGTFAPGSGKIRHFRKGLIVFQYVCSLVLLIATMVVSRQVDYVQNKNLGYDQENLLYLPLEGELVKNYSLFREEASTMPGIKIVDRCSQFPHNMQFKLPAVDWPGKEEDAAVVFTMASVGYDFVPLMNLRVVQGRGFSRDVKADSTNFLINEEAVRQMGLSDPIGSQVSVFGSKTGMIVGVVKDYHTSSLHEHIMPLILDVKEHLNFGTIVVRTEAGKTEEALESLRAVWQKVNPDFPFLYSFMDHEYTQLYKGEQIVRKLSNLFAVLAIVISCMGLLGLALFSAEQRKKEWSIRKVLGATVAHLIGKFAADFLKLIVVALVVAIPLSWVAMQSWLVRFAYKTDLPWWTFAGAAALTVLISLLTIGTQALRSALENPVKNLRSE